MNCRKRRRIKFPAFAAAYGDYPIGTHAGAEYFALIRCLKAIAANARYIRREHRMSIGRVRAGNRLSFQTKQTRYFLTLESLNVPGKPPHQIFASRKLPTLFVSRGMDDTKQKRFQLS